MGKIYFDKRNKKLVYDFNFPEKQTIVIGDTSMAILEKWSTFGTTKKPFHCCNLLFLM